MARLWQGPAYACPSVTVRMVSASPGQDVSTAGLLDRTGKLKQNGNMTRAGLVFVFVLVLATAAQAASSSSSSSSSSSFSSSNNSSQHSESHSSVSHSDQDDARDALRAGKVMPLTAILEIVSRRAPGTVLDAELETEDGMLTYRIDTLTNAGRKVRVTLNARTGDILAVSDR